MVSTLYTQAQAPAFFAELIASGVMVSPPFARALLTVTEPPRKITLLLLFTPAP